MRWKNTPGLTAVSSREEIVKFFSGPKTSTTSDARADIFGLEWVTERILVVDVRRLYLDANGNERGEESTTYTLRRDDLGDLKLHIALMRGEGSSSESSSRVAEPAPHGAGCHVCAQHAH